MKCVDLQDRRMYENNFRRIWRSNCICDRRWWIDRNILPVAKYGWRNSLGGIFMREIIEEYAGMIAGGMAAVALISMMAEFVLGGAGLYKIILDFSQNIC